MNNQSDRNKSGKDECTKISMKSNNENQAFRGIMDKENSNILQDKPQTRTECHLTLEELRKIPVKERNSEEKARYFHLMYQNRKMKKQQSNNNTEKRKSEIMLENDRDDAAKKLKVGKVDYTVEGDRLESAESETNQELMLRERWKRNRVLH